MILSSMSLRLLRSSPVDGIAVVVVTGVVVVVVIVVRDGAGVGAEEENNPPLPEVAPVSVSPGDGAAPADGVPPKLNAISSSPGGWGVGVIYGSRWLCCKRDDEIIPPNKHHV